MAVRQDTIWERFLSPVVRYFIDEEGLRRCGLGEGKRSLPAC
jgi:hypothetical protein